MFTQLFNLKRDTQADRLYAHYTTSRTHEAYTRILHFTIVPQIHSHTLHTSLVTISQISDVYNL